MPGPRRRDRRTASSRDPVKVRRLLQRDADTFIAVERRTQASDCAAAESGQSGEGAARRWTASRIPAAGGMRPIGRISGRHSQFATLPNDVTDTEVTTTPAGLNAIEKFALFQRFLAPPTPSPDTPGGASSISNGRSVFVSTGCALCHTPTLTTGNSTVAALRNQPVNLFSDILVHAMGPGLADNIVQGGAQGDEFRTAPLWGLGQRIFFLHDGRTTDLLQAIQAHMSAGDSTFGPSEANAVIVNFNKLSEKKKQDLLNFLRSL